MLDPAALIASGGIILIAIMIFAESGMFVGFFLPGDTLLITGGVFAASGQISLPLVIIVASLAAIAGDNTGYWIGRTLGPKLFDKADKDSVIFRREYIDRAHEFFEKYGSKAMALAHFVPIVRTFAPPVAGAGRMPHHKFVVFDAIGDIAWAIIVTLLGYYVGSKIPGLDRYILILVALVVVASFAPVAYHLIRRHRKKRHSKNDQQN